MTALDDPVVSNTIYPIPSVAPQYSLMGYNPYNLMIAQQFPWFGTLRLRGEAAEEDVKVALAELGRRRARRGRRGEAGLFRPRTSTSGPRRSWPRTASWPIDFVEIAKRPRSRPAAASRTCSGPRWSSTSSTAS